MNRIVLFIIVLFFALPSQAQFKLKEADKALDFQKKDARRSELHTWQLQQLEMRVVPVLNFGDEVQLITPILFCLQLVLIEFLCAEILVLIS